MKIVKCWVVEKNYVGSSYLHFEATKEDAIYYVKHLPLNDKDHVASIYESFAGLTRYGYEELYSHDIPCLSSNWGLDGGDSISVEELEEIKKSAP